MKQEYAFPCSGTEGVNPESLGMTLRDYFAGKAMQGFLSGYAHSREFIETCATNSYEVADAMLKAREQK